MATDEKPWYHAGLKFQCSQCGNCCTGAPGYVWVNKEEIEKLAGLLNLEVAEFERRYVRQVGIRKSLVEFPNGDCVFFHSESRTCQVYDARPRQCRTWPFWDSNLASPETWRETARHCPGCNRGKLVTLDKIEEQRKVMSL
jgi:Fe-S-cluster containining protein